MNRKQRQTIEFISKLFGCDTPQEVYHIIEKLSKEARIESQIASGAREPKKIKAEIPFEAEILLNKKDANID